MSWYSFKQTYLVKFWSPVPAVIAAGILSTIISVLPAPSGLLRASLPAGVGSYYSWQASMPKSGATSN